MYEYNEEDFKERPSVSEEKISTKKIVLLSIGKSIAGIATFLIVLNFLTPTPSLPVKIIAKNTATTIAEYTRSYYTETRSTDFIGFTYIYGENIEYDMDHMIELPNDYKCTILDSIVVIEHKNGINAKVRWR